MSFNRGKIVFLTLSVLFFILLASGVSLAQTTSYIPLVVDGAIYRTQFVVTNLSASSIAQFTIQVNRDATSQRQDANVLNVPGQTGGQSSATVTVQPGGQVTLPTIGGTSLLTGWATISSSSSIGVSAVFLVVDANGSVTSAVGILPQASQTNFTLIGAIKSLNKTGFAALNPSNNATATVTAQFFNTAGTQVVSPKTFTLAPGTRLQKFFDEDPLFSGLSNIEGSVAISSDNPLQVLTLRLDFPSNSLSALPNLPGRAGVPVQHADATFNWVDATIPAGGTRIPIAGDNTTGDVNGKTATIGLPFPITLFGRTFGNSLFDQLTVTEDGWVSFLNGSPSTPHTLPSATVPPSLVAPFFVDMHFSANNTAVGVFTRVVGTAPNRQFAIEWNNVSFVNNSLGTATFEVVFFEGTSDIKMQYMSVGNDVNGAIAAGLVIGIQDDTRTQAVPVPVNISSNAPHANKVYTFQYLGGTSYTLVQN